MKLKKTFLSLAGLALLSVGTLVLSSNSASAAENNVQWTPSLDYQMGPDGTGGGYTNYHLASDGPSIWNSGFYWWHH